MRARRLGAALLPGLAALACSAAPPAIPADPALPVPPRAAPWLGPARWLVPAGDFVERTLDGLDHVVAGGRRLALRDLVVVESAPRSPEVQGGAVAPAWAGAGPSRYVFWKGRALYGAANFTGDLHPLAALPGEPRGSFAWLGGVGLLLPGGAAVIAPGAGGLAPLPIPAAALGVAADARRALAVDALGHSALTLDGGAAFRDVTSELGAAPRVEVRGEAIVATLRDGRRRFVLPSGEITSTYAPRDGDRDPTHRPPRDEGAWPPTADTNPLEAAVSTGVLLPDGGAVVVGHGFVGRLDLTSLRVTSAAPIPAAGEAECAPIRQGSAVLLACADDERAMIVDVTGTPRIERTFALPASRGHDHDHDPSRDHDHFTGSDDGGLGFLGPCDPTETLAALPEDAAATPGRSAVFCARADRDTWVEHRVDPEDAVHLVAWIPRPGGGAVALIARPGSSLVDADRVEVRGALRLVRVARSEPPMNLPSYGSRPGLVLDRSFRAAADGTIEGWVPSSSGITGQIAVTLDPRGRVRAYPAPPRATAVRASGAFALVGTEDDRLFETTDRGRTWTAVEPPPGALPSLEATCSPVGCRAGDFVRLGWSGPENAAPLPEPPRPPASLVVPRTAPPPAVVALRCRFEGPATGRRVSGSTGLGAVVSPPGRGRGPLRIGAQGTVQMPWNGPSVPTAGDVDIAWIPPLDPAAVIRRVTLALGAPGLIWPTQPPYDARLGYLLDADPRGGLALFPIGRRETCLDSFLDRAGVTRALGGCAGELTVGVDLGDRLIFAQPRRDTLALFSSPAAARGGLRELANLPTALIRGFAVGAGARIRDGAPVLVAVDVLGEALLAPIDPDHAALGPSERLRPLTALALADDATCKAASPSPADEARVVLPFESLIGLDRRALPGVFSPGTGGVALLRWSKERACLDAVEIAVRDERYDADLSLYDGPGAIRKLIARFGAPPSGKGLHPSKAPSAALILLNTGSELRQPLSCDGLIPADH